MMTLFNTIRTSTENLTREQFRLYAIGILSSITILSIGFLYYYYSSTHAVLKRIQRINEQRVKTQELLERLQRVEKQQLEVNQLLEQDKEFKIGGYFSTIVRQLALERNKTREAATSSVQLDNGYTEVQLYASFFSMNMQKVVELLDTLEQNNRIYVKELEIYKPDTDNSVNINIMIATLQSPGEQSDKVE